MIDLSTKKSIFIVPDSVFANRIILAVLTKTCKILVIL